jgi:hypothetical protein
MARCRIAKGAGDGSPPAIGYFANAGAGAWPHFSGSQG